MNLSEYSTTILIGIIIFLIVLIVLILYYSDEKYIKLYNQKIQDQKIQDQKIPEPTEGFVTEYQQKHIHKLIQQYTPQAKNILEIGFNAGHSADNFLMINPRIKLVSFDLGYHEYVIPAKKYIEDKYAKRHILILGDSKNTIPQYHTKELFDVIFVDGGHDYDTAKADLLNCKRFAHQKTLLLMDDTIQTRSDWIEDHNKGPNRSWKELIENGFIRELGYEDYSKGRGMSWGVYGF